MRRYATSGSGTSEPNQGCSRRVRPAAAFSSAGVRRFICRAIAFISEKSNTKTRSCPVSNRRSRQILLPHGISRNEVRPTRIERRARLVSAIARGRRWLDEIVSGCLTDVQQIATRQKCSVRQVNMTISLAFLAPDLMRAGSKVVCRVASASSDFVMLLQNGASSSKPSDEPSSKGPL
jgi:hypothetical protein